MLAQPTLVRKYVAQVKVAATATEDTVHSAYYTFKREMGSPPEELVLSPYQRQSFLKSIHGPLNMTDPNTYLGMQITVGRDLDDDDWYVASEETRTEALK